MSKLETNTIDTISGTTNLVIGSTNGALVGPVTVSGTVTIPSGSTFVIL